MIKNVNKLYAGALYETLDGKDGKETEKIISNFLNFLKEKGDLYRIQKVLKEFEEIYNKKNGIHKLKIKSAFPLAHDVIKKIAENLGIKEYEAGVAEDKSLIGGFVAQYDDNLIDASIKNNLNKLHKQLIS